MVYQNISYLYQTYILKQLRFFQSRRSELFQTSNQNVSTFWMNENVTQLSGDIIHILKVNILFANYFLEAVPGPYFWEGKNVRWTRYEISYRGDWATYFLRVITAQNSVPTSTTFFNHDYNRRKAQAWCPGGLPRSRDEGSRRSNWIEVNFGQFVVGPVVDRGMWTVCIIINHPLKALRAKSL